MINRKDPDPQYRITTPDPGGQLITIHRIRIHNTAFFYNQKVDWHTWQKIVGLSLLYDAKQCCRFGSESGSGSRYTSQRHGSADPDPHQNVMDSQHDAKCKCLPCERRGSLSPPFLKDKSTSITVNIVTSEQITSRS